MEAKLPFLTTKIFLFVCFCIVFNSSSFAEAGRQTLSVDPSADPLEPVLPRRALRPLHPEDIIRTEIQSYNSFVCGSTCNPSSNNPLIHLKEVFYRKSSLISKTIREKDFTTTLQGVGLVEVVDYEPNFNCSKLITIHERNLDEQTPEADPITLLEPSEGATILDLERAISRLEADVSFEGAMEDMQGRIGIRRIYNPDVHCREILQQNSIDFINLSSLFQETFRIQISYNIEAPNLGVDLLSFVNQFSKRHSCPDDTLTGYVAAALMNTLSQHNLYPHSKPFNIDGKSGYSLGTHARQVSCKIKDVISCLLGMCATTGKTISTELGGIHSVNETSLEFSVKKGTWYIDLAGDSKPVTALPLLPSIVTNMFELAKLSIFSSNQGHQTEVVFISKPLNSDITKFFFEEIKRWSLR